MTEKQLAIVILLVLLVGLALPVSYGVRMAIFVALIAYIAIVLIGGGMQYLVGLVD
ncbi:MAG TPA: hypothetical protein VKQ73_14870 [Stellaceae bacterium]|nr:hypothetical protein [Stellaceae bacterium]